MLILIIFLYWKKDKKKVYRYCVLCFAVIYFVVSPILLNLNIGSNHSHHVYALLASVPANILFLVVYYNSVEKLPEYSALLIFSGGTSSVIYRIWHAGIINFIDVKVTENYRWPVFSLADSIVTIGGILLLFWFFYKIYLRLRGRGKDTISISIV